MSVSRVFDCLSRAVGVDECIFWGEIRPLVVFKRWERGTRSQLVTFFIATAVMMTTSFFFLCSS